VRLYPHHGTCMHPLAVWSTDLVRVSAKHIPKHAPNTDRASGFHCAAPSGHNAASLGPSTAGFQCAFLARTSLVGMLLHRLAHCSYAAP
jgi:hypothetical protein